MAELPEEKFPKLFFPPRLFPFTTLVIMQVAVFSTIVWSVVYNNAALTWVAAVFLAFIWFFNFAQRGLLAQSLRLVDRLTPDPPSTNNESLPRVALIAAARNEEMDIEKAVRSWVALDYPRLDIFIVNDHSNDRTPEILNRLVAEFPRLRVIHDPELHEGWLGKANAVWQAVQQTGPQCRWLLLTDADVVMHPEVLRAAVHYAEKKKLDFLTCIARLEHGSFFEEVVLPPLWAGLLQSAVPLQRRQVLRRPLGVGAFILVRRDVYLGTGGHAAIRSQQPEDALLAALVADAGGVTGSVWTNDLVRVRIYRGYADMRRILVRKQRLLTDDRFHRMIPGIFMVLNCDLLPLAVSVGLFIQIFSRNRYDYASLAAFLFAVAAYIERVRFFRLSAAVNSFRAPVPWLYPLGSAIRLWFHLCAAWGMLFHKPMEWRGRAFRNVRSESQSPGV
ncbi:MAG TPA: glycosyltransferase [Candidatus Hydrogenedentes bacterium]|nr:glycosyltransferase [Candidatus Hydrogenedentota bacterium]HOL77490.1 glycosyltransferase [Candidatus Hydrogenedentota bacterium]HPO86263.1 glycosyltransferase [Candidatus Hydrogenedentota bacterium]